MKTFLSIIGLAALVAVGCSAQGSAPSPTPSESAPVTSEPKPTPPAPEPTDKVHEEVGKPAKSKTAAPGATEPAKDEEVAVIQTNLGRIILKFFPDVAPGHVDNFKKLAKKGFYDKTKFHRVIPGFMIQGGDPNSKDDDRSNDGTGGPGYSINAEFSGTPHKRGILSMARSMSPNSAGSQFFICVADVPQLDNQYTVFGIVIDGMDVVDKIVKLKRDENDNPLPGNPAIMKSVKIEKWPVK